MMTEVNQKPKLYSEKLLKYLESYSDRCSDITFIVGPEKQEIKSSRIVLEAGCPRFIQLFDEKWGQAVALKDNEGQSINGIPLPNVDPEAFQLFIKLIISDADVSDFLKSIGVTLPTIFGTIDLCKTYGMTTIQEHLESFAEENFLNNFPEFAQTEDFLKLSNAYLGTLLSLDNICSDEVLIFDAACKWAEAQCSESGVEKTGETFREILGDALFNIRFPLMPMADFCKNSLANDILTDKEQIQILRYMGLSEDDKILHDQSKMSFSTTSRSGLCSALTTIDVLKDIPIIKDPSFVCDGAEKQNFFKVNQNVEILSFGFLGPVQTDGYYDVKIEIKKHSGNGAGTSFGKTEKRVLAKANKVFHVPFDKPICLNATHTGNSLNLGAWYRVDFSLKGPNAACSQISNYKNCAIENNGIGLYLEWHKNSMAEVLLVPLAKYDLKQNDEQ